MRVVSVAGATKAGLGKLINIFLIFFNHGIAQPCFVPIFQGKSDFLESSDSLSGDKFVPLLPEVCIIFKASVDSAARSISQIVRRDDELSIVCRVYIINNSKQESYELNKTKILVIIMGLVFVRVATALSMLVRFTEQ